MYGLTYDFVLKLSNQLLADCPAVHSTLGLNRITNYLLNVRRTFDFELKANNQLPAECTAVHSTFALSRITNYLLNARPYIRR